MLPGSKNKVLGRVQIPKKKLYSISWGLCTGTKAKKWYFSDLVTVLKVLLVFVSVKVPFIWILTEFGTVNSFSKTPGICFYSDGVNSNF